MKKDKVLKSFPQPKFTMGRDYKMIVDKYGHITIYDDNNIGWVVDSKTGSLRKLAN